MGRFTITPWRTQADLLAVRAQLYSLEPSDSSPDSRSQAVSRVMAWKLRGNLPHAVESTALLIDAILHHSIPGNSIFSIRAVYSAAFTRFVTGFCDIGRNRERSLEPSSMLDIAKQIDMPVHFVALRHEATHEELPAVFRLVKAAEDALQWLWRVYWSRLEEPDLHENMTSLPGLRAEAKQILRTYRSESLEALRAKKRPGHSDVLSKTYESYQEMNGNSAAKPEAVVTVLVEDKLLSPSKRELGHPLEGAFLIWDQLLKHFSNVSETFNMLLIKTLLQAISVSSALAADRDAEKEALALWLLHILIDDPWVQTRTPQKHDMLCKTAMTWCCLHPAHWTNHIGKELLEAGDDDFEECWQDIFQASQLAESQAAVDPAAAITSWGSSADQSLAVRSKAGRISWMRAVKPSDGPIGVIVR